MLSQGWEEEEIQTSFVLEQKMQCACTRVYHEIILLHK